MSDLAAVFGRQLAWTVWADREHLRALGGVAAEHVGLETGSSHGSLLGTMAHLLGAEQIWLSRFVGAPLEEVPGLETYPDLEHLQAGFEEHWPGFEVFLASLSEAQLTSDITWANTRGESFTRPLWQPVAHLVQHSAYHRGQMTTMLRQLGYSPPPTDLIDYLRQRA